MIKVSNNEPYRNVMHTSFAHQERDLNAWRKVRSQNWLDPRASGAYRTDTITMLIPDRFFDSLTSINQRTIPNILLRWIFDWKWTWSFSKDVMIFCRWLFSNMNISSCWNSLLTPMFFNTRKAMNNLNILQFSCLY